MLCLYLAGGSGLAELDLSCTYRVDESINSTTSAYSGVSKTLGQFSR